ncbi:MAG: discoidin domain-containing protein [Sedimentisphaerales bacterium]|nr:discoidin domain-containing protein [Sedimentisphaerales bacterium]
MSKQLTCLVLIFAALGPAVTAQAAELAHRWSFNGDLADSVGGQDAVIVDLGANDAVLSDTDVALAGGAKDSSDYIDLADHILSSLGDSATIEVWATQVSVQNWSRLWDFGSSTTHNVFMSWTNATTLTEDRVEWVGPSGTNTLNSTNAPYTLGTEFHVICVFDGATVSWYSASADAADLGAAKGSFQTANRLSTLDDTNCWLGRSQWGDNTANARFNEFRLWKGAMTAAERETSHDLGPDGFKAKTAYNPSPADAATDVQRGVSLSWGAGGTAATHDVYFGTSLEDVTNASRTNSLGVLVREGQDANSYDPPARLDLGQTYYWRIDEVNAAPDYMIFTGKVWHFTVEPYSYPIPNVTATASSVHSTGTGPEKTVNGSGLDADGLHSTISNDMWLSKNKAPEPAWIQFAFGKSYKVDKMLVWNSNQSMEGTIGVGAKDVTVEYSYDAENWIPLGDFEFVQASGEGPCAADTVVDFAGVGATYVRLTIHSNWGELLKQYGLSEVRFLYAPVAAREPSPAPDASNVYPQVTLGWRPGREAASHEVYLGTVIDDLALAATVLQPSYDAATDLLKTYYWQVVEVNDAAEPNAWASDVWSFSTAEYIVVDDFESYTNLSPKRVFQAWIDGLGFSPDEFFPNGDPGNGTGALVGYDPEAGNIMEMGLVHGGRQSMPLYYDNNAAPRYSETERTFTPAQDWSKHGITTLVVYFRGDPANTAAPLYVKINGTKVLFNGGAPSTALPVWKQWNIDLASVSGANLKSVKTLTIGAGNGSSSGTGTIFIDDILLYAAPPQIVTPADPGAGSLVALYAMEGNLQDSSGKGNHGSTSGEPSFVEGQAGYGQAMNFDGTNDYAVLPIGTLLSTLGSSTLAIWVNYADVGNAWQRIFDFGTGATVNMFLTAENGATMSPRFAITTGSYTTESLVTAPAALGTGWHHLAIVIDAANMTLRLYVDGTSVASGPTVVLPKDLGVMTQNWLGRSQYTADPFFTGVMDDFRIYNRALSDSEIRYLAGDR